MAMAGRNPRPLTSLLWLLLLLAARAGCSDEDEFASPTHTPTVQLLRPRSGDVVALGDGGDGLLIAFTAPAGAPCPARPRSRPPSHPPTTCRQRT